MQGYRGGPGYPGISYIGYPVPMGIRGNPVPPNPTCRVYHTTWLYPTHGYPYIGCPTPYVGYPRYPIYAICPYYIYSMGYPNMATPGYPP